MKILGSLKKFGVRQWKSVGLKWKSLGLPKKCLQRKSWGLWQKSGGIQWKSVDLQGESGGIQGESGGLQGESGGLSWESVLQCLWFLPRLLFLFYLLKKFHVILSYNNFDIFHWILKIVYFVNNRIVFVLFFVIYNIFCHVYLHLTINPTTIFYVCAYLLFFVHTTYKHIFMWVCIQKYFSPK